LAKAPSASPRSRHAGSGSRYAPRPDALPRRSTESSPVGERTTRTSSRLARAVRQATQVRCGRLRSGGDAVLTALGSLLLASEERAVLFIQVLLVRLCGLGFDLCHEIVTDLRLLLRGGRLGYRHRLRLGPLGPLDDVDLLATELVHDRLHAQTALADARAPCVESGLPSADRDLRPRAGLASDPDDLDLAVKDLRHLELEEPLHERLVRAAHDDLRSAKRPTDLEHHDLARLPREVPFVRSLLGARQDRRRPAVELHDRRAGVEVADLGVDDVALAVGVVGED